LKEFNILISLILTTRVDVDNIYNPFQVLVAPR